MNGAMFKRLIWKEYRTQRSFWLGVAGIALFIQLILLIGMREPQQQANAVFYIALIFPVFYALGSSGMSFAIEKEEETWSFLRTLAIPPVRFFWVKFGFCFVSTLALGLMLALLASILNAGRLPEINWAPNDSIIQETYELSGFWFAITAEFLIWGIFVSLLTRRVLSAVCLIPLCVFGISYLASFSETYFWVIRFFAFDCVLLVSLGLAYRWLNRDSVGWSLPWSRAERKYRVDYLADVETAPRWRRLFKRLLWQEWRHARPVCMTILVASFILTVWFYAAKGMSDDENGIGRFWRDGGISIFPLVSFICGLWSFRGEQAGKRFRFLIEQGASPRDIWLGKHLLWLGIAFIPALLFLIADLFADLVWSEGYIISELGNIIDGPGGGGFVQTLVILSLGLLVYYTPYTIGQFTSMLFSRGIMAAFVGLILIAAIFSWLALMEWLGGMIILSSVLIPFVLLAATWVRSSDWMLERPGWKPWAKLGTVLLAPTVLVCSWIIHYRVAEIEVTPKLADNGIVPLLQPEIRPNTPEELKTIALYKDATEKAFQIRQATSAEPPDEEIEEPQSETGSEGMAADGMGMAGSYEADPSERVVSPLYGWKDATPGTIKWLEKNQEAVMLTLDASRGEIAPLYDTQRNQFGDSLQMVATEQLARLLLFQARKLESENKLDEALECYLAAIRIGRHKAQSTESNSIVTMTALVARQYGSHIEDTTLNWMQLWSTHPLQTKERILGAISQVQKELGEFPPLSDAIKCELWLQRKIFVEDPDALLGPELTSSNPNTKERAERALFYMNLTRRLIPWEVTRATLLLDEFAYLKRNHFLELDRALQQRNQSMIDWREQHPHPNQSQDILKSPWRWERTTPLMGWFVNFYYYLEEVEAIDREMRNNAHLLTLALVAYRHEHGELPDELSKLVEEEYFDALPLDPWSGEEFRYIRRGLKENLRFSRKTLNRDNIGILTPFLWSQGSEGIDTSEMGMLLLKKLLSDESDENLLLEERVVLGELLRKGHPFPIPKPRPMLPELQSFLIQRR